MHIIREYTATNQRGTVIQHTDLYVSHIINEGYNKSQFGNPFTIRRREDTFGRIWIEGFNNDWIYRDIGDGWNWYENSILSGEVPEYELKYQRLKSGEIVEDEEYIMDAEDDRMVSEKLDSILKEFS